MTAPLIAPVIPRAARPPLREHGRAGPVRRLPLAAAARVPAVPGDLVYGTRPDRRARAGSLTGR